MDDLAQIRANLAKIRELDRQIEAMRHEDEAQRYSQASHAVDYEGIELQLLLEEMEQQQGISQQLLDENQELQRRMQAGKSKFERVREEIATYAQTHNEIVEQQRQKMELEQGQAEASCHKEERRLRQTLELMQEKNEKLLDERKILQAKLDRLKAAMMPAPKKKRAGARARNRV